MEKLVVESFLFGCELTSKTKFYTFQVDEEDDCIHSLSMNTISLGDSAKDEYNVVEVIAHNREEEEVTAQVANLKLSCQPMVDVDCFTLHPPVMFRLKSGSGPVLIAGQHLITRNADEDLSDSETKESSTEDEEEEEEMFAPIKPANKKLRVI